MFKSLGSVLRLKTQLSGTIDIYTIIFCTQELVAEAKIWVVDKLEFAKLAIFLFF